MSDEFSNYYSDFLNTTYDCVDRIILNAYFSLGHNPGGFRIWWRNLRGSEDDLTNTHLMRFAGRMSRRIRAFGKSNDIPVVDCHYGDRKHKIAEAYMPKDPDFVGVFLILINRAPGVVWHIQRSENGRISHIVKRKPLPHVNHYSFHIMDPDWGHITIKICGHPPFGAQIMLNGHEYIARQARKKGIDFIKEGNCFTSITDAYCLSLVADTLCSKNTIGRLRQVCERWIYTSCLCFALDMVEQERSRFHYDYSVYQVEYSRNLLFKKGGELEQIFQGVIDRTRYQLNIKTLRTIFGVKERPSCIKNRKKPREEVVVERPKYNLTVFKLHFGKFTVKLYTKGECVLRVEVIVHNARVFSFGRSLIKFPQVVSTLKGILNRFLNQLNCIDCSCISDGTLEELPLPSQVGKVRVGGIDINKPRIKSVIDVLIELSMFPQGFSSSDLATRISAKTGFDNRNYSSRNAAYDLKKFRAKSLVNKIEKSRRYRVSPEGLKTMVALVTLAEKVIKPVLAGAVTTKRGPKRKMHIPSDIHYQNLKLEMKSLFKTIGIAA
jgi:hypothetical protein